MKTTSVVEVFKKILPEGGGPLAMSLETAVYWISNIVSGTSLTKIAKFTYRNVKTHHK